MLLIAMLLAVCGSGATGCGDSAAGCGSDAVECGDGAAGCGSGTADEAEASDAPDASVESRTENMAFGETGTAPESGPGPDAAFPDEPERISYTHGNFRMSLALPEGWEYACDPAETESSGAGAAPFRYGIRFWAGDFPEDTFGLFFHPDRIGMCGTGVTIEPVAFKNGLTGTSYTEQISAGLWRSIIYDRPEECAGSVEFVYEDVSAEVLEAQGDRLEEILESVRIDE